MIGRYPAKMDDKCRLFVPSKLREALGSDFYVTVGANGNHRCLTVYTAEDFHTMEANFNALNVHKRSGASTLLFAFANRCVPDKQFRFPITAEQVRASGLTYLALGHIHKGGSFQAGNTLCAWCGCPMGRGFDELDQKGVNIVTLDNGCDVTFLPLDTIRFYDWEAEAGEDAAATLSARLPGAGSRDFYRITFIGESEPIDCDALLNQFAQFPNLQLRDRTVPPMDLWASLGEDTLEGAYFGMLRQAMEGADPEACRKIALAARISRQLLDGREVKLP